jgi:hypothetical protein
MDVATRLPRISVGGAEIRAIAALACTRSTPQRERRPRIGSIESEASSAGRSVTEGTDDVG